MKTDRVGLALLLAGLAVLPGCAVGDDVAEAPKGGDEKNGAYDAPTDWWKPHPESDAGYTYAQVSGVVADNPNRIIVGVRGDWTSEGEETITPIWSSAPVSVSRKLPPDCMRFRPG